YTALNDGNVRLGSTQTLSASGLFGVPAGVEGLVLAEQREILPRQETRVSTEVQGVWPLGQLTSTVSTQQVVVGEDVIDVPLTGSQAAVTVWAVPWPQLALLALAAGFVAWRLRLRKRRRLALERARAAGARQAALAAAGAPARPARPPRSSRARRPGFPLAPPRALDLPVPPPRRELEPARQWAPLSRAESWIPPASGRGGG